jgi:hypothetical protein
MKEPSFDIFSGQSQIDGVWIETVQGVINARDRLWQIAEGKAGRYFMCGSGQGAILIKVQTFEKMQSTPTKGKARKAHA